MGGERAKEITIQPRCHPLPPSFCRLLLPHVFPVVTLSLPFSCSCSYVSFLVVLRDNAGPGKVCFNCPGGPSRASYSCSQNKQTHKCRKESTKTKRVPAYLLPPPPPFTTTRLSVCSKKTRFQRKGGGEVERLSRATAIKTRNKH